VPTSRTEITLRAMRFHARIGVLPHEREHAQPVEVDLTVRLRPSAAAHDAAVVDYRELYAVAAGALGGRHVDYLEELAETIVSGALAQARVASARVAVRKPHVALAGPLAYAEVVVERDAGARD
jgi:dihydroneopterin aldolase